MGNLLESVWNPVLAGFVLSAGLLTWVGTAGLPIRAVGRAAAAWRTGSPSRPAILLAASASLTTVSAAVVAVAVGGPGALVWMWIAGLAGMGLHFAEGKLARRAEPEQTRAVPRGIAASVMAVAVVGGGLWQGQQAAELLHTTVGVPPLGGALLVAGLGIALARLRALTWWGVVVLAPAGLAVVTALATAVAWADPFALQLAVGDAVHRAFGLRSVAAGTVGGALATCLAYGVKGAVLASDVAVGAASAAAAEGDTRHSTSPDRVGASLMLVPLLTIGLLSASTGLAMISVPPEPPAAQTRLYPLERHPSRGLRPSRKHGQTVVLRDSAHYVAGQRYAMTLRADPRGHNMAKLLLKENAVVLPAWAVAEHTDSVTFRAREPELAKQAGWDVRIPCTQERFGGQDERAQFIRLKPSDPDLVFSKLINFYELSAEPYVNLGDFDFVGSVARATHLDPGLGETLVMFEARDDDAAMNPKLHEFFRHGYRGPYPQDESDPPPWTFISADGFKAEVNDVVQLQLKADPRGISAVRVNRVGQAEAPPWPSMLAVHALVLRHPTDPAQDLRVPVSGRLDAHRIRFDALDPAWNDLRRMKKLDGFTGPFAQMDPVTFEVEVHTDQRLPEPAAGRRALVPLDTDPRPRGPRERPMYAPHPAELIQAGFSAPHRRQDTVAALLRTLEGRLGTWARVAFVAAAIALAVSTVVGWSILVRTPARALLGDRGVPAAGWLVGIAPVVGGLVSASFAADLALLAYSVASVPVVGWVVVRIADLRRSS